MTRTSHPTDDQRSPEERAVAARLAVLGGPAGPPPELDARILAAARAAAGPSHAASPARSMRQHRRWPAAVGVAASLVIAVGLAWQLGAVFQLPPLLHHEPRVEAPAATSAPAGEDAMSPEVLARAQPIPRSAVTAPAKAAAPPAPTRMTLPAEQTRNTTAARPASVPRPAASARSEPPEDFVDEALANAKVSPAPAAESPASAAMDAAAAPPGLDRVTVTGSRVRRQSAPTAAGGVDAGMNDGVDETRLGVVAWIRHIRSLRDGGRPDAARASLQRFIAAHPGMRIPRDLQPLAPPRD